VKPDPAWRGDYGKSTDMSEPTVAVMLPTGGTTGTPRSRPDQRAMVASSVSSRMALDYRKGDRGMISLHCFMSAVCLSASAPPCRPGTTIVIPGRPARAIRR